MDLQRPSAREDDGVQTGTRLVLVAFAVFTLLATNQLLVFGAHTERLFAWTIRSPANAAFLGAAYAAGFVLSVLALRQRRWSAVRVALVTVTAFTLLTLVATLLHVHRLHLAAEGFVARSAAWVWLTVYLAVPVACLVTVARQQRGRPRRHPVRHAMPALLVAVLVAQGAALASVGVVLLAAGARLHVTTDVLHPGWPWPVAPLTSQAVGAWFMSFGIAIVLALRERDLSRMFVPAVAYSAFGVFELLVLLRFRTAAGTDVRWWWIDAVVLASLIPTGAYGAWVAHRASGPAGDVRQVPAATRATAGPS